MMEVDRSRAVRYRNGSCPYSPFANALALHHRIATTDPEKAWHLIAEEKVVVTQAEISEATLPELEARLRELKSAEQAVEAFTNAMRAAAAGDEEDHEMEAENDSVLVARLLERVAVRKRIADLKRAQSNGAP